MGGVYKARGIRARKYFFSYFPTKKQVDEDFFSQIGPVEAEDRKHLPINLTPAFKPLFLQKVDFPVSATFPIASLAFLKGVMTIYLR